MRALALWLSLAVAEEAFLRGRHLSVSDEVARDRAEDVKFRDVFGAPRVQLLQRNAPDVSDEVSRERGEDIQIHDGFGALESKDQDDEKRIKKNRDLQAFIQTAPDMSDEVARERGENIQIHDGFGAMESKDQEEEKRIKKNRDLQALMQLRQRNAPDVSDEVARERGEDIQIHDGFGAMESKDQEDEKRIKKNRDMQAFIQTTRNAPDVSDEVARERGEDIQIHDGFGAMESKDQDEEKRIKKNRDLQALMQLRQRNAPDVSDEVARERGENIQIHDGFGAMESKDQDEEKRIKKNKDLQALMQLRQRNAPDVSDEVARERGEDIQIHDGFGALETKDKEDEKSVKKNPDLRALMQLRR